MKDYLSIITDFLKVILLGKWEILAKLTLVVFLGATMYTGYQVHFNDLKIYNPNKLVVIDEKDLACVEEVMKNIQDTHECVQAIGVYLYQPKSLPKKEAELILLCKNKNYTNIRLHKFLDADYGKFPLNIDIYRTLARIEVMDIDGLGGTQFDYELKYDNQINYARVYGLYNYAAVFGSVVILFNREKSATLTDENYKQLSVALYNDVRYINDLMFK